MLRPILLAGAALLAATPALADDDPRFCPTRPSLGSSACTVEPGHVLGEASLADWTLEQDAATRTDTVLAGDLEARFGVGPHTEVQVGWTSFGHVRDRDKATGTVDVADGVGDVRLALRQNFRNPDGKGLSFGAEPFVTLPVGRTPVGRGDWGAGVVLPVSYDVSDKVNLAFTGQPEALPDEDGHGRHLSLTGIAGLGYALSERIELVGEVSVQRDDDPAGHRTPVLAAGSVAWQPGKTWQLDLLVAAGLNHDAPDVRVVTGGAVLF